MLLHFPCRHPPMLQSTHVAVTANGTPSLCLWSCTRRQPDVKAGIHMGRTAQLNYDGHGPRRTIKIHCFTRDGSRSVVSSDTGAYWPFIDLYVWPANQSPADSWHTQGARIHRHRKTRKAEADRNAFRKGDLEVPGCRIGCIISCNRVRPSSV